MEYYLTKDELYHHGILGQKWGVRRYQNPDGTLTAEGKERYRKIGSSEYMMTKSGVYKYRKAADGKYIRTTRAERKALNAHLKKKLKDSKKIEEDSKNALDKNRSPRDKKINEMTDKQLEKYIARLNLEKAATEVRNKVRDLDPKPVSKGDEFKKMMMDKVVIPTMQDAGKKVIDAIIKKATTKETVPDKYAEAKKESDYMNNIANIENKKADYNRTKALNDKFEETKDTSVYNTNSNSGKGKDKDKGKDKGKDKEKDKNANANSFSVNGFKLSDKQIEQIGKLFNSGTSIKNIANSTGASVELISKYLFSGFNN